MESGIGGLPKSVTVNDLRLSTRRVEYISHIYVILVSADFCACDAAHCFSFRKLECGILAEFILAMA